jgi:hypothetical protein
MNKIIFPLKLRMQGPMVADLQDGLRLLLVFGALDRASEDQSSCERNAVLSD